MSTLRHLARSAAFPFTASSSTAQHQRVGRPERATSGSWDALGRYTHDRDAQGRVTELSMARKDPWSGDRIPFARLNITYTARGHEASWTCRITYDAAPTGMPGPTGALVLLAHPDPATDPVMLPDLGAGVVVDPIAPDGRMITGKRTEARGVLDIRDLAPGHYVASFVTTTGSSATTTLLKH